MADQQVPNRRRQESDPVEVKEDIWWMSGEYLSAASTMVAWQFIDSEENYEDIDEFAERLAYVFRQHCPVAYGYFFDNNPTTRTDVPSGVIHIVLDIIKKHRPLFMPEFHKDV